MDSWSGLDPPYATIVADPPWPYKANNPPKHRDGYKAAESLPYSTMSLEEITALPVSEIAASDSRLYLWVTNRYLRHAWHIVESWGFQPHDRLLVWCKLPQCTANVTTEFVLIGRRGSPPRIPWSDRTHWEWPRGRLHSQKPDAFLDLVEQWSPPPFVELFARQPRLGWDHWGSGYEIGAAING